MSFLAEVISCAEKIEAETLIEKVGEVSLEVTTYKEEVNKFLNNIYIEFREGSEQDKLNVLLNETEKLTEDITNLKKIAEELTRKDVVQAAADLQQIKSQLYETDVALVVTTALISIHEACDTINVLQDQGSFADAVSELKRVQLFINDIPQEERVCVVDELIQNLKITEECLINKMNTIFFENVIMHVEKGLVTIKISANGGEIKEVLKAFALLSSCIDPLDQLTKFLWDNVFVNVVDNLVSVETLKDNNTNVLRVNIISEGKKSDYKVVFNNLSAVLGYLTANLDFKLNETLTALKYIGRDVRDNLSEIIIKHCLEYTIPNSKEGLEKYKKVIEDTESLQKELVQADIFADDTKSIIEYANNIDILFINKKCSEYSNAAIALMKKDLHDMTEVGSVRDPKKLLVDVPENEFPRCSVSKSCIELLQLAENLLQQCATASDVCAGRLLCTAQNIFYKYGSVVQEHHQKLLETIPQQVALFYDNCQYMAHKIEKWNGEYTGKITANVRSDPVIFKDQPLKLRTIGNDCFANCVKQMIDQIESTVKECGLERLQSGLEPTVEKGIRQCLRQQELLKTVWQKILPYSIYNRTLGTILNSLCGHLVRSVLKVEDIPSATAEQLVDIYKVVLTRGPKLFTDPREVGIFVPNWNRLGEVVFVLGASLADIDDRWADGKGPLALQFQPEDVRKLIRALFQNTDRRAVVLSKIRD